MELSRLLQEEAATVGAGPAVGDLQVLGLCHAWKGLGFRV